MRTTAFVFAGILASSSAMAADVLTMKSAATFDVTKARLVDSVKAKGFGVIAEVDHAAGAKANNLTLAPTHLVIFGNPRGGTPLMTCNQLVGIDLPLKALIWQDAAGVVNVSVNTPAFLKDRHKLDTCGAMPMANMETALKAIVTEATQP
jgi:uncharacterized protein (DUF302 family)